VSLANYMLVITEAAIVRSLCSLQDGQYRLRVEVGKDALQLIFVGREHVILML
jgi:hypothetical protein